MSCLPIPPRRGQGLPSGRESGPRQGGGAAAGEQGAAHTGPAQPCWVVPLPSPRRPCAYGSHRPKAYGALTGLLSPACAQAAAEGFTSGLLLQGVLALLIVLALLLAFLWLLRRLTPGQAAVQGVVRVVGGVMLGARERLVVVEVADQWLLLGVAAGRVDHLYTMPRPADLPRAPSPPQPSPFAARLAELLPRRDRG